MTVKQFKGLTSEEQRRFLDKFYGHIERYDAEEYRLRRKDFLPVTNYYNPTLQRRHNDSRMDRTYDYIVGTGNFLSELYLTLHRINLITNERENGFILKEFKSIR